MQSPPPDMDPVTATLVMIGGIGLMVYVFFAKRRARREGRQLFPWLERALRGSSWDDP